ncbi:flavin reductase family protein [Streptomyces lunalinharesii]|uniref:Flavin reductase family protein n=1 Tax=Streptomyces lunalinharesii TaxID=333384 RepID=A0ABN3S8L4_9ACTN
MERLIEPTVFRDVLGRFASGITMVATLDADGAPAGLACQSFASLSLEPPLILLCIGKNSTSWPRIAAAGRFAVSVLAEEHRAACASLAASGTDKFAGLSWRPSPHGTVHLDGALATVDCALDAVHEAGDHLIVTGRVLDLTAREDGTPLLYFRGGYATGAFA